MLATRMRMAAAGVTGTPAAGWWVVAGKTCVAAYQPIGAASLAASYTNLANPGTYDAAPGVAPTWASGTGWTFNGTNQYLTTSYNITSSSFVLARVANLSTTINSFLFAVLDTTVTNGRFGYATSKTTTSQAFYYGTGLYATVRNPDEYANLVIGLGNNVGYLDGVLDRNTTSTIDNVTTPLFFGARNFNGSAGGYCAVDIVALAIYSDTLSGAEVAILSAAMAALT